MRPDAACSLWHAAPVSCGLGDRVYETYIRHGRGACWRRIVRPRLFPRVYALRDACLQSSFTSRVASTGGAPDGGGGARAIAGMLAAVAALSHIHLAPSISLGGARFRPPPRRSREESGAAGRRGRGGGGRSGCAAAVRRAADGSRFPRFAGVVPDTRPRIPPAIYSNSAIYSNLFKIE